MTHHIDALVAEIGSTTTLVNAFDGLHGDTPRFIGQGSAATSVAEGDVRLGLQAAIDGLNGRDLDGRALTVNVARPMEPRSGGYGGGRR